MCVCRYSLSTKLGRSATIAAVRRALIEVYTLKEANIPLSRLGTATTVPVMDYSQINIGVSSPKEGMPALQSDISDWREKISLSLEMNDKETISQVETTAEPAKIEQPIHETAPWLRLPITDLDIKFAVRVPLTLLPTRTSANIRPQLVKRIIQLTGVRFPDPVLSRATTVEHIVEHLLEKPKPKKLAEKLISEKELAKLPNVQLFPRRHTPIHKHKEVGRWKVIEEALKKRQLPVTGSNI